ncbi:MAG: aminodeoxychorismate synthase component I [Proteobacteria bacterium]|nr:aminodeoxychorismate synthase component I [Pseudomonadota bacterium]
MAGRVTRPASARLLGRWRPDFLAAHAAAPARFPFLLESASAGTRQGRYDLLLAAGRETLWLDAGGALVGERPPAPGFLAALDEWFAAEGSPGGEPPLPFIGGWFVYLGYELAAEIEPRLRLPPGPGPVAFAARVPAAAIYDHARGELWLVGEAGSGEELAALEAHLAPLGPAAPPAPIPALALAEEDPDRYRRAVMRALEYIAAGDIYQANLAREWRAPLPEGVSAAALYAHLRRANPGPFAGLAALPGMTVLSTSPERLVAHRDGRVETRPIAGTRPRRGDDAAVAAELRANAKEQAEHVMLLDLERNDLGRICAAGTVEVDEYMTIESYAHVHHIVSNVRGLKRPEVTPGGVIRALFPGGTITGCPKVRCMEIIAELEGRPRGAYTGAFGYLGRDGNLDLNILIRTATVRALPERGRELSLAAGAGIVADSDPGRELEETRAKARGLVRALGAERG